MKVEIDLSRAWKHARYLIFKNKCPYTFIKRKFSNIIFNFYFQIKSVYPEFKFFFCHKKLHLSNDASYYYIKNIIIMYSYEQWVY